MKIKRCSRCDKDKPITEWSTSGKTKTGKQRYKPYCKSCCVDYNREKKYGGRTRTTHIKTDTHRECMECRGMFEYSKCNGSYCKACFAKRFKDPEKAKAYTAAYRARHPERWRAAHRVHQFNRRSLIKATDDGTVTDVFLKKMLDGSECYWCKKDIPASLRTIEHITELNDGGHHSASNLTMACLSCNSKRLGKQS